MPMLLIGILSSTLLFAVVRATVEFFSGEHQLTLLEHFKEMKKDVESK